jgi:hypothetical protein
MIKGYQIAIAVFLGHITLASALFQGAPGKLFLSETTAAICELPGIGNKIFQEPIPFGAKYFPGAGLGFLTPIEPGDGSFLRGCDSSLISSTRNRSLFLLFHTFLFYG